MNEKREQVGIVTPEKLMQPSTIISCSRVVGLFLPLIQKHTTLIPALKMKSVGGNHGDGN